MAIRPAFRKPELKPKPKVLPIIKPMARTIVEAARAARVALSAVGPKLSPNDPIRRALETASSTRNVKKVKVMRG